MKIRCYRPVADDSEARVIRLTAHDKDADLITGVDVVLRWHKTPNENKNKTWSGAPEISVQGRTERRDPIEMVAIRELLSLALAFSERLVEDPDAFSDADEQWSVDSTTERPSTREDYA